MAIFVRNNIEDDVWKDENYGVSEYEETRIRELVRGLGAAEKQIAFNELLRIRETDRKIKRQ